VSLLRRVAFLTLGFASLLCVVLASAAASKQVELTWLVTGDQNRQRVYDDVIGQFEEETNVKITILLTTPAEAREKLLSMIAGGITPDLVHIRANATQEAYRTGAIEPLDGFIKRDRFDTRNLAPAYRSMLYDNGWYGMPFDGGGFVVYSLYYNRDMFERGGVAFPVYNPDRPEMLWTQGEYRKVMVKLTQDRDGDGALDQFGASMGTGIYDIAAWSNGGDILNESGTRALVDQQEFYEGFQWWADLRNVDHVMPWPGEAPGAPWLDGRLAVRNGTIMDGATWVRQGLPFDWGVIPWPRGQAGSVSRREMNPIAISATSQHKDEAWRFIKFWLSDRIQYQVVIKERAVPPQTYSVAARRDFWFSDKPPYDYRPFIFPDAKEHPYSTQWQAIDGTILAKLQPA
jgi:multiple sugar transport system substrate-binding protein